MVGFFVLFLVTPSAESASIGVWAKIDILKAAGEIIALLCGTADLKDSS